MGLNLFDVDFTLLVTSFVIGIEVTTSIVYLVLYMQGLTGGGIKARAYAARQKLETIMVDLQ